MAEETATGSTEGAARGLGKRGEGGTVTGSTAGAARGRGVGVVEEPAKESTEGAARMSDTGVVEDPATGSTEGAARGWADKTTEVRLGREGGGKKRGCRAGGYGYERSDSTSSIISNKIVDNF